MRHFAYSSAEPPFSSWQRKALDLADRVTTPPAVWHSRQSHRAGIRTERKQSRHRFLHVRYRVGPRIIQRVFNFCRHHCSMIPGMRPIIAFVLFSLLAAFEVVAAMQAPSLPTTPAQTSPPAVAPTRTTSSELTVEQQT